LELFIAQQADLRILTLPEDLDPCDFLHKYGAEAFSELLASKAIDALDHAYDVTTRGIDVERDVHGVGQAIERLLGIVARAPRLSGDTRGDARIQEQKIVQRLAGKFRVDEQELRRRLTALRRRAASRPMTARPGTQPAEESATRPSEPMDSWQHAILELVLAHPDSLAAIRSRIGMDCLTAESCRLIYETCCRLADENIVPTFDRLMLEFDEPAVKSLLVGVDERIQATGQRSADPETLLNGLVMTRKREEVERQRPAEIATLREGGLDDQQQAAMLEDIIRQRRNTT
jgi:DNA primase